MGDGNPDPATQTCQTNDGHNITRFSPLFPAGYALQSDVSDCHTYLFILAVPSKNFDSNCVRFCSCFWSSVTAVGGTVNVPEIAVFFSGGGFSNYVSDYALGTTTTT